MSQWLAEAPASKQPDGSAGHNVISHENHLAHAPDTAKTARATAGTDRRVPPDTHASPESHITAFMKGGTGHEQALVPVARAERRRSYPCDVDPTPAAGAASLMSASTSFHRTASTTSARLPFAGPTPPPSPSLPTGRPPQHPSPPRAEAQVRLPAVRWARATPPRSPSGGWQGDMASSDYLEMPAVSVGLGTAPRSPSAPPSMTSHPAGQSPAWLPPPVFRSSSRDSRSGAASYDRACSLASHCARTTGEATAARTPVPGDGGIDADVHVASHAAHKDCSSASSGAATPAPHADGNAFLRRVIQDVHQPPLTLLLFLQSAPPKVIFSAFQSDCAAWGVNWYSGVAQRIAVFLFLHHPVSRRYPPRSGTLRSLLKQYITLIEQPEVALRRKAEEDIGSEDPVDLELMEAYIECTVSTNGDNGDMCYKSFYNVNADDVAASAAAATRLMIGRLIDGATLANGPRSPSGYGSFSLGGGSSRGESEGNGGAIFCDGGEWDTPNALLAESTSGQSHHHHRHDRDNHPPQVGRPRGGLSAHGLVHTYPTGLSSTSPRQSSAANSAALAPLSAAMSTGSATTRAQLSRVSAMHSSSSSGGSSQAASLAPRPCRDDGEEDDADDAANEARVLSAFCSMKVAVGQFSNVGLSLWPAAFVLVQLMAQEMRGLSRIFWPRMFPGTPWPPTGPLPNKQRLRILELGAGVGLTPALLNKMQIYRDCVDRYVATDYQPQLLQNIKENFSINQVTEVEDFRAAEHGLEGDKARPFHLVSQMDWTQRAQNQASLVDWGPNLILAADCIYDVEVIPALVDSIEMALTAPSTDNIFEFSQAARSHGMDAPARSRTVVVVQTHRQNSTMKHFFDRLKPFARVQSFTLVAGGSADEWRRTGKLSATKDGRDGGLIPLGECPDAQDGAGDEGGEDADGAPSIPFTLCRGSLTAAARAASELSPAAARRHVCALRPDTVLEDGSLASLAGEPPTLSPRATSAAKKHSALPPPSSPSASTSPASRQRSPRVTPQLSLSASFQASATSSFLWEGGGTTARVEALLRDELIGSFYTPMAGLIGVHVIQLKRDAKLVHGFGSEASASGEKGGMPARKAFGFGKKEGSAGERRQ